jgi:hypothetical protein
VGVNGAAAVHGETDACHKVVVEEKEHGLDDVLGSALALDEGALDRLPPFGLG